MEFKPNPTPKIYLLFEPPSMALPPCFIPDLLRLSTVDRMGVVDGGDGSQRRCFVAVAAWLTVVGWGN